MTLSKIEIVTFYHYFDLEKPDEFREDALEKAKTLGVRGLLLVAHQGVNSTLAGHVDSLRSYLDWLEQTLSITLRNRKYSRASDMPFKAMRIRVVDELITFGRAGADPRLAVGEYVCADDWNALIKREDVLLLDTRNRYETAIGTFRGAIDPDVATFGEFASYVDENLDPEQHSSVAMFCTGGIRCEVATSYLKQRGFENVYHLEGGILKYLEEKTEEESLWDGQCFVFDQRMSVGHGLKQGSYEPCIGCGWPIDTSLPVDEKFAEGISCSRCHEQLSPERIERARHRLRQRQQTKAIERKSESER